MMRVNGTDDGGESSGPELDDMIEADNSSLRERVHDLEKKVLDQGDEIICLRSTLANVVRRLEQIEGYTRTGSADSIPRYQRNGSSRSASSYIHKGSLRQPGYITASATDAAAAKEPARRVNSYTNSNLPQRRQVHYQSTGSLHSQHSNHSSHSNHSVHSAHSLHSAHSAHSESHSSSSVSPVPTSPSPTLSQPGILRHTPVSVTSTTSPNASTPNSFRLAEPSRSVSQTSTPVRTASNLSNSKRWSSTGDFASSVANSSVPSHNVSRYSAKSLLNLSKLQHSSYNHTGMHQRHGFSSVLEEADDEKVASGGEAAEEAQEQDKPDISKDAENRDSYAYEFIDLQVESEEEQQTRSDEDASECREAVEEICFAENLNEIQATQGASWDPEDGALRIFLRGRPIVLYAPTDLIESYDLTSVATAPSPRLKLDWVYGYRGRDCRSNLYFLPTGEMVYFIAAVVVLYNVEEQTQRHYLGHTDDVKCLAVHPNKMLVATGQCAGHDRRDAMPHIRVWNTVSLHTMAVIGMNDFDRAVCCVSFSKSDGGSLLVAVDESTDHIISVWDWQKGEHGYKITDTKCSVDTVVAAEFHPLDRNCIVTCGKSHVNFWVLDQGGTLYKRMGIFENRDKPKYVTCLAFLQNGDILSGDSNGNIIVWGQGTNTIAKIVKSVHEGPIFSLCVLKDGSVVSGGGKDGRLVLLDAELRTSGEETPLAAGYGAVRHIAEGRGDQLLIGTTRNCILVGSVSVGLSPVVIGHTEELWACAAHPSLAQFATGGFDSTLCLWDSMAHSLVWSREMPEQVQSVGFSPDGAVLVVGFVSGRWQALDAETRDVLTSHLDGQEPLQTVRFSPDGRMLALGSRDNTIYVYQVSEDGTKFSKVGRCVGHSSFITHLDWSADSQMIRSNSGDYELLFWQAEVCRQIPASASLRDVEWASHTCTITFQTVGIWPDGADGTDVNNCARSSECKLMVTADDYGKVKLYSYPVSQPKSLCHVMGGHSSHVTHVEFLQEDSRIVSTGGKDMSVMQWMLT